jgi:hypothetical protein
MIQLCALLLVLMLLFFSMPGGGAGCFPVSLCRHTSGGKWRAKGPVALLVSSGQKTFYYRLLPQARCSMLQAVSSLWSGRISTTLWDESALCLFFPARLERRLAIMMTSRHRTHGRRNTPSRLPRPGPPGSHPPASGPSRSPPRWRAKSDRCCCPDGRYGTCGL